MSTDLVLSRLRRFLLAVSAILCVGTLVELIAVEHTESLEQWIPFGLSALVLLGVGAAWLRPDRQTLLVLRGVMVVTILGSLFGIYEHISNNIAFRLEIRPNADAADLLAAGLGGANPLLAPGILALAAVLALAATYQHPALDK